MPRQQSAHIYDASMPMIAHILDSAMGQEMARVHEVATRISLLMRDASMPARRRPEAISTLVLMQTSHTPERYALPALLLFIYIQLPGRLTRRCSCVAVPEITAFTVMPFIFARPRR